MDITKLDEHICRLARDGVVIDGQPSRREGISPFLWKLMEMDHLLFSGKERDGLRNLADEIHQLTEQWHTDYPPIFAVTGLKNAGKSALVKTFLSQEGRSRIPTGDESKYATRRYVFWLPASLKTSGGSDRFESMLKEVFSNEPEALSHDPENAKQQYRRDLGFEGMKCPLIAYDTNLNSWKTGIVDCPDIETGDGKDNTKLSSAKEMLERVSRLCAAFVVIGQYENLERDVFWHIVRLVHEVRKNEDSFLVVNKCPPKHASNLCSEIVDIAGHKHVVIEKSRLFASYNFMTRGVENFCLSVADGNLPEGSAVGDEDSDVLESLLPTFFRCYGEGPFPPNAIHQCHLLQATVQELPSDSLRRHFQMQMARELHASIRKAENAIDTAGNETKKLIEDAYQDIAGSLLSAMMTKDGVVSPLQNPKLAKRQLDLLIDEAPMTIKASMKVSRGIRNVLSVRRIPIIPSAWLDSVKNAMPWLRRQGVELDSDIVATLIAKCSSFARVMGPTRKNSELAVWLNDTFKEFHTDFDREIEESLRPLVKAYYKEMSGREKVKAHLAAFATFLLIVGAVLVPIDGGGSLWGVSMLEGILIAGSATGANLFQSRFNIRSAEKPLIEEQLSFLTARIACRAGLPALATLSKARHIREEAITYALQVLSGTEMPTSPRIYSFQTDNEFIQAIQHMLHSLQEHSGLKPEGDC